MGVTRSDAFRSSEEKEFYDCRNIREASLQEIKCEKLKGAGLNH